MFVVAMRLWSQNLLTKSYVEAVPTCIVAFIEYHNTPKVLKMASGIKIPFEWCEGRRRKQPWCSCLLNFIGERRAIHLVYLFAQGVFQVSSDF